MGDVSGGHFLLVFWHMGIQVVRCLSGFSLFFQYQKPVPVLTGRKTRVSFKEPPKSAAVFIADTSADLLDIVQGVFQLFPGALNP